jgi:hypothetical protein
MLNFDIYASEEAHTASAKADAALAAMAAQMKAETDAVIAASAAKRAAMMARIESMRTGVSK